jgi:PhnB protein
MSPDVQPIPAGYPRVTPALVVDDAGAAIEFYRSVLGAEPRLRVDEPSGKVGHAELAIGDSLIMLSDEYPEMDIVGPKTVGGTGSAIYVYVDDVDDTFERAVQHGAKSLRPVSDQFYGDRTGQFEDPFGHRWGVATHIEDVSPDEIATRAAASMRGSG